MRKIGIIDIGSNSMRLVIVQIRPDGSFKIIDELRESARLGEEMNGTSLLKSAKIQTAIEALKFFRNLCDALAVSEIICVATEAVRRAKNKSEFAEQVLKETGIQVQILSGAEEAYYDYLGTVNTLDLSQGLIMDIGGSSTELVLVKNRQVENLTSLPFGALTLAQMFHLEGAIKPLDRRNLQRFLKEHFKDIDWLKRDAQGDLPLIGIGGSFRNIGKIHRKMINYPLDVAHNYPISSTAIQNIYEMIGGLSQNERKNIKGLSKDRADIFPGALAAITQLLEFTGTANVIISGAGLREGIFYKHVRQTVPLPQNLLDLSLQNVMHNYEINENHANHVWDLARQLYHQFQKQFDMAQDQEKVLQTAALLHDSGISVSYYDHHKHSFYLILNSRINGLTQKELMMAAWAATLHRKDEVRITAPFRTFLSKEEIQSVQQLGMLLRISESLDRRQNGNVDKIECTFKGSVTLLKVSSKVNPGLEINDALSVAPSFKKVFKNWLQIEEA
ncbi:exopolyphosphatase [Dehalobacterium formicoaceticum]|uniref:Exopolyphosphatase n=1 Tax=Dehalobacterium formicoaceticum TaxID=51515 RepID=A0ABT1Y5V7_9FIRM|nr:exopolyphosphatase [Dehalobacterium formicoaceticum]MCR6545500.1 exopolyphosphatase [Dehalobacterium formicoaceticum]